MMRFAYKAAAFPAWGSGLLCVAVGVIATHAMLPLRMISWRSKALLSSIAAIIAGIVMYFEPLRRPFDLGHANLSNQWLVDTDLSGADLAGANLAKANLFVANLNGAYLAITNLSGARLSGANLAEANLDNADLRDARGLTGEQLEKACGNEHTKLPEGLTLEPCTN
jgi:hypothetical protein